MKDNPTYITSLRIQREWVDLARHFNLSLQDACVKGIKQVCEERISELTEQQIAFITQHHRNRIEVHQEEIMHLERVLFDAKVRDLERKRKKTAVREWDGQQVIVAVSK